MSPEDFSNFQRKLIQSGREDLAHAARLVFDWLRKHPDPYVELGEVLSEYRLNDPTAVAGALALMSEKGLLKRKFAVSPRSTHTHLKELYDSVREIPDELYDYRQTRFSKDDAEIYPVFERT